MNGAEHYRYAEQLAAQGMAPDNGHDTRMRLLAAATVHAKLAEVALAASLARSTAHMTTEGRATWREIGP